MAHIAKNDRKHGVGELNVLFCLAIIIVALSTGLRLWARVHNAGLRNLAIDDFLVLLATVRLPLEWPVNMGQEYHRANTAILRFSSWPCASLD